MHGVLVSDGTVTIPERLPIDGHDLLAYRFCRAKETNNNESTRPKKETKTN